MKNRKRKMLRMGALLLGIFLFGCARSGEDSSLPGLTRKVAVSGQPNLLILNESGLGPGTETALADLQSYLKVISGVDFPREEIAGFSPAGEWRWGYKNILVIGKDPGFFPGAVTKNVEAEGYSLAALESGDNLIYFVYSPSSLGLQFGIYKFLTLLGVRFLHPAEEFVPSGKDLKFPETLAVKSNPAFSLRGYHIHLLHPLEYFEAFLVPSDEHLEEAKGYINWLVKNGQNYVQWSLLKTIDLDQWIVYADRIAAYAHSRGVKVGINVIAWGGSSLQNSYVLVENTDDFAAEVRARLEYLLRVPWDLVVAGQGEFIASDPAETIGWFDTMAETAADIRPETEFAIEIHVGDYENMYLDYQGERLFYYYLPRYSDPRVSVYAHTVMFYDLYRPAPGLRAR